MLKGVLNLQDWDITCRLSQSNKSDCLGKADIEQEYKRAIITLYPLVIKRHGNGENPFRVLVHELCEVVMAEHLNTMHPSRRFTDEMMEYRDRCAEHLTRIVLTLLDNIHL